MNVNRRHLIVPLVATGLVGVAPASAASMEEDAVAKNVEAFRTAQFAADAKALDALCAAELSYSHSDAHIEDKATFVKNATAGKSKFLSLEYQDPRIRVVGPAAIVRFHWVGEQEAVADGKKSSTNLHILMNWQKQGADGSCCRGRPRSSHKRERPVDAGGGHGRNRAFAHAGKPSAAKIPYAATGNRPSARRRAARSASRALRKS